MSLKKTAALAGLALVVFAVAVAVAVLVGNKPADTPRERLAHHIATCPECGADDFRPMCVRGFELFKDVLSSNPDETPPGTTRAIPPHRPGEPHR